MIKIAGSVNHTMDLDSLATDNAKDEIILDDQDPIPVFTEFRMSRYSSQKRVKFKLCNTFIHSVNKGKGSTGTVCCDELQNRTEIILGNRKVPKSDFTGHSLAAEVLSPFVGG